jgi:hypothetical protein
MNKKEIYCLVLALIAVVGLFLVRKKYLSLLELLAVLVSGSVFFYVYDKENFSAETTSVTTTAPTVITMPTPATTAPIMSSPTGIPDFPDLPNLTLNQIRTILIGNVGKIKSYENDLKSCNNQCNNRLNEQKNRIIALENQCKSSNNPFSGINPSSNAKLPYGTPCLLGTTCNNCEQPASDWGILNYKCGKKR